jgi:hypothetical protein
MEHTRSILASATISLFYLLVPAAEGQTTWTVKPGGGPGIDFPSIALAGDFAQDGDTILVFGTGSIGLSPFQTDKAWTVFGANGAEPIGTSPNNPIVIEGLPAGKVFRMAGFLRPGEGALDIRIRNCQGLVILEDIIADEPSFGFPNQASIEIQNCASVVLRRMSNFGSPALKIENSSVLISQSYFWGASGIQGGPGGALVVSDSDLLSVASRYLSGGGLNATISAIGSNLQFAGDGTGLVLGNPAVDGPQEISAFFTPLLSLEQSQMTIDPKLPLKPAQGQPLVVGNGTLQIQPVPGVWNGKATVGNPLQFSLAGEPLSSAFLAIGSPSTFSSLPLGVLAIDLLAPYAFLPAVGLNAAGVGSIALTVPNTIPPRTTFSAQGLFLSQDLKLGLPSIFMVR